MTERLDDKAAFLELRDAVDLLRRQVEVLRDRVDALEEALVPILEKERGDE